MQPLVNIGQTRFSVNVAHPIELTPWIDTYRFYIMKV